MLQLELTREQLPLFGDTVKEDSHSELKLRLCGLDIEDVLLFSNLVDQDAPKAEIYIDSGYVILEGMKYEVLWVLYLFQQARLRAGVV